MNAAVPDLNEAIVEQSPDAIIVSDAKGMITVWNRAAESLFGFAKAEAIGQTLDLIIPERFREAHWKGFDRALAAGSTKYAGQSLLTRSQRKDGSKIYVELGFAILKGARGEILGVMATGREKSRTAAAGA